MDRPGGSNASRSHPYFTRSAAKAASTINEKPLSNLLTQNNIAPRTPARSEAAGAIAKIGKRRDDAELRDEDPLLVQIERLGKMCGKAETLEGALWGQEMEFQKTEKRLQARNDKLTHDLQEEMRARLRADVNAERYQQRLQVVEEDARRAKQQLQDLRTDRERPYSDSYSRSANCNRQDIKELVDGMRELLVHCRPPPPEQLHESMRPADSVIVIDAARSTRTRPEVREEPRRHILSTPRGEFSSARPVQQRDTLSVGTREKVSHWLHNNRDDVSAIGKIKTSAAASGTSAAEGYFDPSAPLPPLAPGLITGVGDPAHLGLLRQLVSRKEYKGESVLFWGNPLEYPRFITQFKRTSQLYGFSEQENLARLADALRGEARDAVRDYFTMADGLGQALAMLDNLYGNPRLLLRAMHERVRALPTVKENDPDAVVSLLVQICNLLAIIEANGTGKLLDNDEIMLELSEKLPYGMRVEWASRMTSGKEFSLPSLRDWLQLKIKNLVMLTKSIPNEPREAKCKNEWRSDRSKINKGKMFTATAGESAEAENKIKTADNSVKRGVQLGRSIQETNKGICHCHANKAHQGADSKMFSNTSVKKVIKSNGQNRCGFDKSKLEQSGSDPAGGDRRQGCPACGAANHGLILCPRLRDMSVDERWEWVTTSGRCSRCLAPHSDTKCGRPGFCIVAGCRGNHHSLLHGERQSTGTRKRDMLGNVRMSNEIALKLIPVTLYGSEGRRLNTVALLDEGSSVTLLKADLADQLGLKGPTCPLQLSWTNNVSQTDPQSRRVTCKISGTHKRDKRWCLKDVRTTRALNIASQSLYYDTIIKNWPNLSGKPVVSYFREAPGILIGQSNWEVAVSRQVIAAGNGGPALSRTLLGWTVHGNVGSRAIKDNRADRCYQVAEVSHWVELGTTCPSGCTCDQELHTLIKNSFTLESPASEAGAMSKESARAVALARETSVMREDGRWETGLLWRSETVTLPHNREVALRRLQSLERRFSREPEFGRRYAAEMQANFEKGYVRELNEDERSRTSSRTWYLPHQAVVNPAKPEKFRIVFDASAKRGETSLNTELLTGPDLLNNLPGILMQFRQHRYAASADIKEMYPHIWLRKEDQDSQRFLWREPGSGGEVRDCVHSVVLFGATSSPFSAQFVKNENAKRFENKYPEAVKSIVHLHYMDDYLESMITTEVARQRVNQVKWIHEQGGFTICKWVANDPEVLRDIPDELHAHCAVDLTGGADERVLGMWWSPPGDYFTFRARLNWMKEAVDKPTKREVLRAVMRLFDPLGLILPVASQGKMLMQSMWRVGLDWDESISGELVQQWEAWLGVLKSVEQFAVPRWYGLNLETPVELHIFADASELAYAAVAYLVSAPLNGEIGRVAFVAARGRTAPLKPVSIPRLELQAALLAVRLLKEVLSKHLCKPRRIALWTDSRTVLAWVTKEAHNFKTFVALRVGEIQENTEASWWRWIPTTLNPADLATRPLTREETGEVLERWVIGPEFLLAPEKEWPTTSGNPVQTVGVITELPEVLHYSTLRKAVRGVAWLRRFIAYLKVKVGKRRESGSHVGKCTAKVKLGLGDINSKPLQVGELRSAELSLIYRAQREMFPLEIERLSVGRNIETKSRLLAMTPFLDENGLLRVSGRTRRAMLAGVPWEAVHPLILEPTHPLTRLIIMDAHDRHHHLGQETVLHYLQERFWILRGRQAVRSAWNRCARCVLERAKPQPPQMADLPVGRVAPFERPFTHTGIDYFGPFDVLSHRYRKPVKRYGVLFTCLTIRAVHIEVTSDLSASGTVMAFRRFACRRGWPVHAYSDNGTNLRGAEKIMRQELKGRDQNTITNALAREGTTWHFNPPAAPHMGGSWERLVQSIKKAIHAIMPRGTGVLREEVIATLFTEAEAIVNARPLTHVPVDPADEEALTPNHFLLGTATAAPVPGTYSDHDLVGHKPWRVVQRLTDHFWKRWVREYLPTLARRDKWAGKVEPLAKGDLVIIVDPNAPRGQWRRGVIERAISAKDGQVRSAVVRTTTGTIVRPAVRLARLTLQSVPEPPQSR